MIIPQRVNRVKSRFRLSELASRETAGVVSHRRGEENAIALPDHQPDRLRFSLLSVVGSFRPPGERDLSSLSSGIIYHNPRVCQASLVNLNVQRTTVVRCT